MKAVSDEMQDLLQKLMALPFLKEHYLAGGTNLALCYNHRTSIDLDFFTFGGMEQNISNKLNVNLKNSFGNSFESLSVTSVGVFGFIDNIKVDLLIIHTHFKTN